MLNRRTLLRRSALLSLAPTIPSFLARAAHAGRSGGDGRVLVVVQLDGGNDGINTIVPYADEDYARHRKELRLPGDQLCKLNGEVGLHPSLRPAADLVEAGRLAIVQGVGYPNPNRSHFRGMAIWQTARLDREENESFGWLGRALDSAGAHGGGPGAVHVGVEELPRALRSRRSVASTFADASDLRLSRPVASVPPTRELVTTDVAAFVNRTVSEAYTTAAELAAHTEQNAESTARYPSSELAQRLKLVAQSIKAGMGARVYYVIQSGYDTHAAQLPTHARLLGEFAGSIKAFQNDLTSANLADRVLLMAFSEFGRRVAENGSLGTDHGTAGPVFLAGPVRQAGPIGATPRLGGLVDGDLKSSIDFRQVYASVLEGWLGLPARPILGGSFEPLGLVRG